MKMIGKYLLIVTTLTLVVGIALETLCLDGLRGVIFSPICKDTTVYAAGYSDEKYRRIKIGMSKMEVISILGNPLKVGYWDNMERLCYSTSSRGSHYRIRQIAIANGKVAKKTYYYYLD